MIDAVAPAGRAPGWKAKLVEEEVDTVRDWKALSAAVKIAKFSAGLIGMLNAALNPPVPAPAPVPAAPAPVSGSCTAECRVVRC